MKTIIFFIFLSQIAYGQIGFYDAGEITFDGWIARDTVLNTYYISEATEYPSEIPIYKVVTENRIDTLETEFIIVAGADGILRKERRVTILKEYGKISDKFGTYNPTYVKYRRLNGELLDVVLLKQANYDYIISGN